MPDRYSRLLPVSSHEKSAYSVARYAAIEAGEILKARFSLHNDVQVKGKRNLVTEADLLSESKIIATIHDEFPGHAILSEESGDNMIKSEYTWVIDPLDGTNNYHFGIPFFCVNIALARQGEVILGMTYDPMRNEMFHSVKGKGTYLNRKKVVVSDVEKLGDAAVGVDLGYVPECSTEMLAIAGKLWTQIHCLRLMGSSCLGLAYVASGRISLYFHKYLYPWDLASGILLTREAGGKVVNFDGTPAGIKDRAIIASNSVLLDEFTRWLNAK